jgi:5'(3')-deoxyribonucleotidase
MAKNLDRLRVLLDMDEVLTDFVGGALALWGHTVESVLPHWAAGSWSVVPPLAAALGQPSFTDSDFWGRINGEEEGFWLKLRAHPWAGDLIRLAEAESGDDWYVVSAPSRHPRSLSGKASWLKAFVGPNFDRLIPTRYKHVPAQPGVVLIDDSDRNVQDCRVQADLVAAARGKVTANYDSGRD